MQMSVVFLVVSFAVHVTSQRGFTSILLSRSKF